MIRRTLKIQCHQYSYGIVFEVIWGFAYLPITERRFLKWKK